MFVPLLKLDISEMMLIAASDAHLGWAMEHNQWFTSVSTTVWQQEIIRTDTIHHPLSTTCNPHNVIWQEAELYIRNSTGPWFLYQLQQRKKMVRVVLLLALAFYALYNVEAFSLPSLPGDTEVAVQYFDVAPEEKGLLPSGREKRSIG